MNTPVSIQPADRSRPRIALMMVLAAALGAAAAGSVSAASPRDEVPRIVLRYSPDSLASAAGARQLYHRLVRAAEQVCPVDFSDGPFVTRAVRQCRAEAIARAVHAIDSPRLAEVYAGQVKRG
jgi:UrcA family protein